VRSEKGSPSPPRAPVDLPERQRTLRATIDWSYGLLTVRQRELHAVLATFAGGARIEDARIVAAADAAFLRDVEALVAGSLLRSDTGVDAGPRLSMLETVREYALERLALEGRLDDVRGRHADRFFALSAAAEAGLAGPDQAQWLDRLEREHDNVRAALDWAFASGRGEAALEAVSALGRFWRARGHLSEARAWLRLGLEIAAPIAPAVRARALWTAARQAMAQSDYAAAAPQLEEALGLFRGHGDATNAVFALCELSLAKVRQGEAAHAEALADEALRAARRLDEPRTVSAAINNLGNVYNELERFGAARELFGESLALRRGLGDSLLIANTANNLGFAAMRDGDLTAAEAAFTECPSLARRLGDTVHTASATLALGEIALATGDPHRAADLLREALVLYESLGDDRTRAECLHALGGVAAAEGRSLDAVRLWGAADGLRERLGAGPTSEERAVERQFWAQVAAALDEEELGQARAEARAGDALELVTASLGIERTAE
jgi:tetratricopeptide (TPR) repeat protein